MSKTQQQKQQVFTEKLQAEGADGFADGPRPWEQWDESGNQGNDRIWEGSARRIYPKQAKRSIGDRLLSGLAVVALATLMVGIAGVYLSTTTTPQLASSAIHPAPIITDRQTSIDEDIASDATVSLASLEALSPPAAGNSATPGPDMMILEPALQPAPAASTAHFDRVAVETVITEAAITTTVYTQQPTQDQPELVATIETTPPPFTSGETAEQQLAVTASAQQNATIEAVAEPAGPAMIARAEVVATEPLAEPPPAMQTTTAVADQQATAALKTGTTAAQTEPPLDKAEAAEEPATLAMNSSSATVEAAPDIAREIETTTATPVLPDAKTGKWVINISSYTRKSTAERMLAVFKQKGIEAEVFTTMINDKPMHRIRVAGFQSSRAAKAGIPAIEQALGLDDVWVSRR